MVKKTIIYHSSIVLVRSSQVVSVAIADLHIDDFVNHTCANGGLCVDGVYSYSCNCTAGYIGERCLIGW